jgi:hypothetical protein
MKNTSTVIKLLFFAVACTCLLASQACAAGNNQSCTITIQRDPGGHAIRTTIDKSGGFSFRGLKAGKYTLSVTLPEPAKDVNTGRSDHIQHPIGRVVNTPEGVKVVVTFGPRDSGRTTVKIALPKGGMISGTVLFSDPGVKKDVNQALSDNSYTRLNKGRNPHTPSPQPHNQTTPIPGIDIVVRKQPGGSAIKAVTDNKGGFTFRGLKAGDYTLNVIVPPKMDMQGWYIGLGIGYNNIRVLSGGVTNSTAIGLGTGYNNIPLRKGSSQPIKFTVAKDGQAITGTLFSSSDPGVKKDVNSTLGDIASARVNKGKNTHHSTRR